MFLSSVEVLLLLVFTSLICIVLETPSFLSWLRNRSRFFVLFVDQYFALLCRDMFLLTVEVLLLLVFTSSICIVLETPSVSWLRNQSIVFVLFVDQYFAFFCRDMFLSTVKVLLLNFLLLSALFSKRLQFLVGQGIDRDSLSFLSINILRCFVAICFYQP